MGQPAAKMGDTVTATDTHIIMVPSPGGPVPTPTPMPFAGKIASECSETVFIGGQPAAVIGSMAMNEPPHIPAGGPFQVPPTNQATIISGSETVMIDGQPAARNGDTATTCNDPAPLPVGTVVAVSTVLIG
jgi:uncharacterized Zn-binding protein involved in type VI secretion